MKFLKVGSRFLFVTVGIIVLTSFTIDATDTLRGSQSALSIFAGNALEEDCPEGMTLLDIAQGRLCVDLYENGVGVDCGIKNPSVALETKANIEMEGCVSVSEPNVSAWTQVTYHQAKTLCAKRDMRLPTSLEWYEAALGTPDDASCNIDGQLAAAGSYKQCVSSRGVYDSIGNVWEWVDAQVTDGLYENRTLPESGYVAEVDAAGVALSTNTSESDLYNKDYFWSDAVGTYAVIRGGFHGSAEDAGIYATHMKIAPSFSGSATGFRCVRSL